MFPLIELAADPMDIEILKQVMQPYIERADSLFDLYIEPSKFRTVISRRVKNKLISLNIASQVMHTLETAQLYRQLVNRMVNQELYKLMKKNKILLTKGIENAEECLEMLKNREAERKMDELLLSSSYNDEPSCSKVVKPTKVVRTMDIEKLNIGDQGKEDLKEQAVNDTHTNGKIIMGDSQQNNENDGRLLGGRSSEAGAEQTENKLKNRK